MIANPSSCRVKGMLEFTIEIDADGTGLWVPYETFAIEAGKSVEHPIPRRFLSLLGTDHKFDGNNRYGCVPL